MPLSVDLMGVGMPSEQAVLLGLSALTSVAAAGTTQGTATALTQTQSAVTTASSATGVILSSSAPLDVPYFVRNLASGTDTAIIYPPTSGTLNGGSANVGIAIPLGATVMAMRLDSVRWSVFSTNGAGGGVPAGGLLSASPRNFAIGGLVPAVSTDFTNATPVITEVYFGEVFVGCNVLATGIAVFNGSDVTGNMKLGLYDSAGALLAQTASTAGSGTDAYQRVPFTATINLIGPATYYIANSFSSATARYNSPPLGSFGTGVSTAQVYGTLPTTITPPTTFTTNISPIASLY